MPSEKLVLRRVNSVELPALSMDLYRLHVAINVFGLPVPQPWQDRMKVVSDTIGMLQHFDPTDEPQFQHLASGFQGQSEDPYLSGARQFHTMGLPKPAAVIEAYCALARSVDLDPEALEYNEEEDREPEAEIDGKVREQLQALRVEWIKFTQDVRPEILRDYLSREIPVRFQPDVEFNAYWVGQISASDRFRALPDEPLRSQHAARWRTHKKAAKTLANHKIEIFYAIWTEFRENPKTTSSIIASNRGLLRIRKIRQTHVYRLESWPEGEFILDFPPD